MNSWQIFLEYAKSHPHLIPKNTKQREKTYHQIKNECFCGKENKLCTPLKFEKKIENKNSDNILLKAKIKALEEKSLEDDKYIHELEKQLKSTSINRASTK